MPENTLFTYRTSVPARLFPDSPCWRNREAAVIDRYWNGVSALQEKGYNWNNLTEVFSLWDSEHVYFRFHCWYQTIVSPVEKIESPGTEHGPDVLMIFLKLPGCDDYFELAISPDGSFRDLHVRVPHLRINTGWSSGLVIDSRIDESEQIWKGVLRLPYSHLAVNGGTVPRPSIGDVWRASFGRVVDSNPEIEYLAWRPTFTSQPDFHVPHSFGNLIFIEE